MHHAYEKPTSHESAKQINGDLSKNPTSLRPKQYQEPNAKDQSRQLNGDVSSVGLLKVFFTYQQELPRGAEMLSAQATYTRVP